MKQFIGKEFPVEDGYENTYGFSFYTKPDVWYEVSYEFVGENKVKLTDIKEHTILKISQSI